MEFRRSGQRDDRRRRVLMDETGASAREAGDDAPSARREAAEGNPRNARRYAEAAIAERQPRITDLIPTRPWSCWVLLLLGLLGLVAVEFGFARSHLLYETGPGNPHLAPLQVRGYGTLAAFFASSVLCASAVMSVMTYWVRRHKVDDYRGRYRIWLWSAAALALAALESSCGLHRVAIDWVRAVLPGEVYGTGRLFWALALGLPPLALAIRLGFEMRGSRLATTALLMTVALFSLGTTQSFGLLCPEQHVWSDLLQSTLMLGGYWFVGACSLVYLRHVFLDSQNRLPAAKVKSRAAEKRDNEDASPRSGLFARRGSRKVRVDEKHAAAGRHQAQPKAGSAPDSETTATNDASSRAVKAAPPPSSASLKETTHDESGPKLSKAERRRLRKLKRRQGQDHGA